MKPKKFHKCEICKMRTEFPVSHYLDFHYRREKDAKSKNSVQSNREIQGRSG